MKKSRGTTNTAKIRVRAEWDDVGNQWIPLGPANRFERRRHIEFFIEFSEIDPFGLRPGDVLNLSYALFQLGILLPSREFAHLLKREVLTGDAATEALTRSYPDELASLIRTDPSMLEPARDVVRQVVEAAADRTVVGGPLLEKTEWCFDGRRNLGQRTSFFTHAAAHGPKQEWMLGLKQSLMLAATLALNADEAELIRRCPRKECQRVFLAKRPNQEFCTRKCVNIAGFERHKAKVGEEAYRLKHAKAVKRSRQIHQRKFRASAPSPRTPSKALPAGVGT